MKGTRTIHEDVFVAALAGLKAGLGQLRESEAAFLRDYRSVRIFGFRLEFLAKFLRKTGHGHKGHYDHIQELAKDLEDHLGAFNEIDELWAFAKAHDLEADQLVPVRAEALRHARKWLNHQGWTHEKPRALDELSEWIDQLEWLSDPALRSYARERLIKALRDLQKDVNHHAYDPSRKRGYDLSEVETKVHELRRDIRKMAMYMTYLEGVFVLTDTSAGPAAAYFADLERTPLADSEYAKLPKARLGKPLKIPRPLFLAINRYVDLLGRAKDWAQNRERWRRVNQVKGKIRLDHVDLELRDFRDRPTTFDGLVNEVLREMRAVEPFTAIADYLEAQPE